MFKNITKFEKILIIFACIILVVLTHFIVNDGWMYKTKFSNKNDSFEIGNIKKSQNDVRKKSPSEFIWTNPKSNDVVYQGDSIFTGPNSKATVTLSNGSTIDVAENSLVVLDIKDDDVVLDLKFGQFQGEIKNGSIKVKNNNNEAVKLDGQNAVVTLTKTKTGKVNVKSVSGKAKITSNNKQQFLETDKSAEISKGKLEVTEFYKITTPTPQLNINIYPDIEQKIEWTQVPGTTKYELMTSSNTDFFAANNTKSLSQNQYSFTAQELLSSFYWKVKAFNKNEVLIGESDAFSVTTNAYEFPQILEPQVSAQIEFVPTNYKELKTNINIKVHSPQNFLTPVYLEIASEKEFKKIIFTTVLKTDTTSVPLNIGEYFARVREDSKIALQKSLWSPIVNFSVRANTNGMEVQPPTFSQSKYKFYPFYNELGQMIRSKAPKLSWQKAQNASNYEVEVSKNTYFTNSKKYTSTSHQWTWNDFDIGDYYIKVRTQSKFGNFSEPTQMILLQVMPRKPILNKVDPLAVYSNDVEPQNINVSWSHVPEASSYKIEYATNENFNQAKVINSRAPASAITLPEPGKYKWRVKALDKNNKDLSEYSDSGDLEYILKKPLIKPTLLSPFNQSTIYQQIYSASNIWLEWRPVEGAENYLIEMDSNPLFNAPVRLESKKPRYLVKDKLRAGKTYWRIRAIASQFESGWSEPHSFNMKADEETPPSNKAVKNEK